MISSLSARPRDNASFDQRGSDPKRDAEFERYEEVVASPTPVIRMSIAPDNSVRSTVISGQISQGDNTQGSEEEVETTEIIYNTIVLPDGSKLLQVISKYADGTTRVTTTRMPGSSDDESGMTKDISKAVGAADEDDPAKDTPAEMIARSSIA